MAIYVCIYNKGREDEITEGELYYAVSYNAETNLVFLEDYEHGFDLSRFEQIEE